MARAALLTLPQQNSDFTANQHAPNLPGEETTLANRVSAAGPRQATGIIRYADTGGATGFSRELCGRVRRDSTNNKEFGYLEINGHRDGGAVGTDDDLGQTST